MGFASGQEEDSVIKWHINGLQLWQTPVYLLLCFQTENRNIWASLTNSALGCSSCHICRFQRCSPEHQGSLWLPGQSNSPLLPHSYISDVLHTHLWQQETTGTHWQPGKLKWNILCAFLLLHQAKFSLMEENETTPVKNSSWFTTSFSLTDLIQLVFPELSSSFTQASTWENVCIHLRWHWQRFRLHRAHHFSFIKEVLLTSSSSCPLCHCENELSTNTPAHLPARKIPLMASE